MKPPSSCLLAVLLAVAIVLLGCAGNNHSLQSVSISPATTHSQVQFTATGIYETMPTSVDITGTTTWCIGSTSGLCSADVAAFAEVTGGLAE